MIVVKRTIYLSRPTPVSKENIAPFLVLKSELHDLNLTLTLLHVQNAIASDSKIKVSILLNKLTFYSIIASYFLYLTSPPVLEYDLDHSR